MLHEFIILVGRNFIHIAFSDFRQTSFERCKPGLVTVQVLSFSLLRQHLSIVGSTVYWGSMHFQTYSRRHNMPELPHSDTCPLADIDSIHAGTVPRTNKTPHDTPLLKVM